MVIPATISLNVALPSFARDTGATQTQLTWIVDAYALVFTALLLPAHRRTALRRSACSGRWVCR